VSKRKPAVRPRAGIGGSDGIDDSEPLFKIAKRLQDRVDPPTDDARNDAIKSVIGNPHADDKDPYFRRLKGKIKDKKPEWLTEQERAARTPRDVLRTHHKNITIDPLHQSFDPPQVVKGDLLSAKAKDLIKKRGRRIR
jgi:hypothetical protein